MIATLILIPILVWAYYKALKLKSLKLFLVISMVFSLQFFCKWPFHFSSQFAFGVTSLVASGACFYKFYKKRNQDLMIFGVLFLLFGIVFLINELFPIFLKITK